MKQIKSKRSSSKTVLVAALSIVLVLLLIGYFITKGIDPASGNDTPVKTPPEIIEGESTYLNSAIAYPRVSESSIQYILVKNRHGSFDLTKPDPTGAFWLRYDDGSNDHKMILYTPPITGAEGDFDYETLYAKETGDGYGSIYMLTYLSVALGTPYFNERIPLPDNKAERDALLKEYGFAKDTTETIIFEYVSGKDDSGKDILSSHTIVIGGQAVSGSGYYFMVDDRNYVYYTTQSYYEYALRGFHTFINGMLVSAGIPSDSSYEPYLTTDFKEWANQKHTANGERVEQGSTVVIRGDTLLPVKKPADYVSAPGESTDGYFYETSKELSFDLEKLKSHHDFGRISSILTGLNVGDAGGRVITLTLADGENDNMLIDFSKAESYKYKYTILSIESIITDSDEITAPGTTVGNADLVKVSYFYYIDGASATSLPRHAVLDISSPLIPDEVRSTLRSSAVGALSPAVSFEIDYTKDHSYRVDSSFVLTGIIKIYNSKGEVIEKVADTSYVTVTGYELVNGVKGEKKTISLDLSNLGNIRGGEEIKNAIVGSGRTSSLSVEVAKNTSYYEVMRDFTAYTVDEVKYFVTSKLVTSFRFVNASKRDPYYGESFYENTFDKSNPYSLYGLNASACEKVVAYLGGIGASGSVTSAGFSGETVAVGLNHTTLDKYDLYAYRIYFELPRHITDITEGTEYDDDRSLSDYDWYSTLGFNLYISDKKYDPDTGLPFRYVGSDMYDLVAKVYGEELDFVEYSFTEFWARRNFLLTSIDRIENIEVDFKFDDFSGKYNFEVDHEDVYVATVGDKMIAKYEYFEGSIKADKVSVYISATGDNRPETEFEKIFEDNKQIYPNAKDISISQIYSVVQNGGEPMHEDIINTVGVANFKSVFELTQLVRFHGELTEQERARAEGVDPVMTIRVKLDSKAGSYYTYDFIRFDDRKVMVKLYETDALGNKLSEAVSDYYITTFALKKLANNYINLLNGVSVDRNIGYFD